MRIEILAFALGVATLQMQESLPADAFTAGLLAGGLLLAALPRVARSQPATATKAVRFAAWCVLGFAWAALLAGQRLADNLPEAWEGRDLRVTGVVAALPQRFEHGERFEFAVESVEAVETGPVEEVRVPRRIVLSWYRGRLEEDSGEASDDIHAGRAVRPGERWRFTVRLKRPHGNANPQGFDYEAWLFERGLRATGYVRPRGEARRLDGFVAQPAYLVERLRDELRGRFAAALPEAPYAGILAALAVGDQRAITAAQWTVFRQTGVTHLMSISGLHVTMFAALFAALSGGLWRRSERLMLAVPAQKAAIAAGWLAAAAYSAISGFSVPTQRTLYMLTVVALTLWSGRHVSASRCLLLALAAVLLLDPWAVFAAGFWLSFGAVALLFFVGSARLGNAAGWRGMLAQWGLAQWAATLGTLPVLLLLFQQFSLVSPLANALAIPAISFVVTPLALLFAALPWPPLLQLDHWLLGWLMQALEWLAGWPLWQQAAPPLWAAVLAVPGVLWLLLPRGFPARGIGAFLLLPLFFWPPPRPAAGEALLDVLDVGQGLAVVVRTAGHALLYDTGPLYSAESDAGQRIVVPYLRAIGVERLDALVVTHSDKDHSGGVSAVREALPIARTLTSAPALAGERCVAGQQWEWDGVRFSVLHPSPADYGKESPKTNHMSCVLRVENAAGSVLLTSDIEAADERALLARAPHALRSDVLLVPHHGSGTSSTPAFVAAVGAREAIVPVGYRNRFRHPRPDVVERYSGSRLWRTDRDGAVQVTLGDTVRLAGYRQIHRRYWHGQ